nr:FAD-binding oxidoreductase [Candidatus Dormibacteraeota bacterium]
MTEDVLVLGCGVSGLTTAVCLAEAGLRVRIRTEALAERTTSAAAGAMWGPYLVEPRDRVEAWSRRTLDELRALAGLPETGVRMVAGIEAARQPVEEPWWGHLVPDLRRCDSEELSDPFVDGFRFTVPLVDMPAYLGYLMERFHTAGGQVDVRRLDTLTEAAREAPILVNCTGIGAHSLVPDEGVWPIRGQLVVVENPGIDEFFSEDTGLSSQLRHIYPHGSTVMLGGSADEGSWDLEPDPETSRRIIQQCAEIDPRLRSARVLGHRVGLRPARARVRVEEETVGAAQRLFHNYGHGGAGVTLSWG